MITASKHYETAKLGPQKIKVKSSKVSWLALLEVLSTADGLTMDKCLSIFVTNMEY